MSIDFEKKVIVIGVLATACKLLSDGGKHKQLKVKRTDMYKLIDDLIENYDEDFLEAYKLLFK